MKHCNRSVKCWVPPNRIVVKCSFEPITLVMESGNGNVLVPERAHLATFFIMGVEEEEEVVPVGLPI